MSIKSTNLRSLAAVALVALVALISLAVASSDRSEAGPLNGTTAGAGKSATHKDKNDRIASPSTQVAPGTLPPLSSTESPSSQSSPGTLPSRSSATSAPVEASPGPPPPGSSGSAPGPPNA